MRTGTTHDFPAWLERLHRRFDRWRQTRDGRSRIPATLWASAVKAAGRHGLNPTARALGLDYYSLKKRFEADGFRGESDRKAVAKSAASRLRRDEFIELAPVASACSPECILELEHPGGAKMRVHLTGMPAPDLAVLSRSFWGMET
jgi:hypothetical protein